MTTAKASTHFAITNAADVARTFPTKNLAPKVLNSDYAPVVEAITGPAGHATVKLSRPALKIISIIATVTATGAASPTALAPVLATDYSVVLKDATGVCAITEIPNTSRAAETWTVTYEAAQAEGTIGGQTVVTNPAKSGQITP